MPRLAFGSESLMQKKQIEEGGEQKSESFFVKGLLTRTNIKYSESAENLAIDFFYPSGYNST